MFAKNTATTVAEYCSLVPDDRKEEFNFLHDFIQKAVPKLETYYATNMIGYGKFYYLDAKKQKLPWPIIALACQKNYSSIYVCAIMEDKQLAEDYIKDLGKLTKSLSCIRFKNIEEINLATLKKVLKYAQKNPGLAGARMVDA